MAKKLPDKIEKQIDKAGLPTGGAVPFEPELERNKKGKQIIKKDTVTHGPKKGKKGYVDTQGRIWIKDRAHAGSRSLGRARRWRKGILPGRSTRQFVALVERAKMRQSMTTSRNSRVTHQGRNSSFGLLANGSCGSWEIAIDETTSGAERWYAQIDGPAVAFYFEIPSVDIVGKMARFLEPRSATTNQPPNGSLVIGKDKRTPITLVKDDEYNDRFFLVIGPMDNPIVRFAITGTDVIDIAEALKDVKKDLDDKT